MRMKNNKDMNIFTNYEEFGSTEVIADLIGPLIDISKIKDFCDIEYARYLTEEEIADKLSLKESHKYKSVDILNKTKEALQHPKLAVRLVDTEMTMQLCKAKTFCSIKIVSTVRDEEVFKLARKVLIDYSKQMIKYDPCACTGHLPLEENDFQLITQKDSHLPGILLYYKEKYKSGEQTTNSYRIAIDDDSLTYSTIGDTDLEIPSFQEWIGGIQDDNPIERLKIVLGKREHIYKGTEAIKKMCEQNTIQLNHYKIMNDYYVYSINLKEQLKKRIDAIKHIVTTGKAKSKPICVFLAGAPGTGKSYFVDCFAKEMKCNKQYPVTSLSGVASASFYDAIEHHVEQVYNTRREPNQTASVAFLDEIDTKSDYFAFRFLMDAMTGSRTNKKGVSMQNFKSGTVEDLVWFFAGSAGATRQEFMNQLKTDERKVIDFFDRIHFDMQLPAVDNPGQSILTLMSGIYTYWNKSNLPKRISTRVLLAFACTKWTSTRSIMTICRVAAAHQKATESEITLELFEGIDTSEEFHKQYTYIKNYVHDTSTVEIEW